MPGIFWDKLIPEGCEKFLHFSSPDTPSYLLRPYQTRSHGKLLRVLRGETETTTI